MCQRAGKRNSITWLETALLNFTVCMPITLSYWFISSLPVGSILYMCSVPVRVQPQTQREGESTHSSAVRVKHISHLQGSKENLGAERQRRRLRETQPKPWVALPPGPGSWPAWLVVHFWWVTGRNAPVTAMTRKAQPPPSALARRVRSATAAPPVLLAGRGEWAMRSALLGEQT